VNRFLAAFRVHQHAKTSTLMATTGRKEIDWVQNRHKIRMLPVLGALYSLSVQLRSASWAGRGDAYPGLPPGLNYDLNEIWGVSRA